MRGLLGRASGLFSIITIMVVVMMSSAREQQDRAFFMITAVDDGNGTTTYYRETPDGQHRHQLSSITEPFRSDSGYLSTNGEWLIYWQLQAGSNYHVVRHKLWGNPQPQAVIRHVDHLVSHSYVTNPDKSSALLSVQRGGLIQLYRLNADASQADVAARHTNNFGAIDYNWSPNSRSFNFYVVGGTSLSYVVTGPGVDQQIVNDRSQAVVWSPDGDAFFVTDDEGYRTQFDVDAMDNPIHQVTAYEDIIQFWLDDHWVISRLGDTYWQQRPNSTERQIIENVRFFYPHTFDSGIGLAMALNQRDLLRLDLDSDTQEVIFSAEESVSFFFFTDRFMFGLADNRLINLDMNTYEITPVSPSSAIPNLPSTASDIRFFLAPNQEWLYLSYLETSRDINPIRLQIGLNQDNVNKLSMAHIIGFSSYYGQDWVRLPILFISFVILLAALVDHTMKR